MCLKIKIKIIDEILEWCLGKVLKILYFLWWHNSVLGLTMVDRMSNPKESPLPDFASTKLA